MGSRTAGRSVLWSALLVVSLAGEAAATHTDPLPIAIGSQGWSVSYTPLFPYACMPNTPIPAGADRNFLPTPRAFDMLQSVVGPLSGLNPGTPDSALTGYGDLGFQLPPPTPIFSYDCAPNGPHTDDCDNGSAGSTLIRMPSTRYCQSTPLNILRVMGHELFHHVQYEYIGFSNWTKWGRTAVEGSARMMEDQIFSDLDGLGGSSFINEANDYLQNSQQGFWSASYDAALGWKYAAEQFGAISTEPELGSDFVRLFWENAEASFLMDSIDTPREFENTIKSFAPGKRLQSWFHDFSIANVTRQYDLSSLSPSEVSRYSYIDENDGNMTSFANIVPAASFFIPSGASAGTLNMNFWSTAYLLAINADCNPGDIMGFRATDEGPLVGFAHSGDKLRWAVLGLTPGGTAERVEVVVRGGGDEFGAAFVLGGATNYTQMVAAITATDGASIVDYAFDCGPGAMTIGRPLTNSKVFVGPPGPERKVFGVVVRVTGPAAISAPTVKGVRREDFSVYVGTNNDPGDDGEVLSVDEVGESYFLTVHPPDKGDTNTYDLHVNLGGISVTEPQAVSYEEKVIHEMIALDKSGSMLSPGSPGGALKIFAAQSAASLLVDWARADGKIGAVSFDGNAQLLEVLDDATSGHKDRVKDAIDSIAISPLGLTSIGDGVDRSLDELVPAQTLQREPWILLLTDGHQTAPLFWANVEAAVQSAGVKVAAFGLGDDADHDLMSLIEDTTGGVYISIDSDGAGGGSGAGGTGSDPIPNALADAYLIVGESAEGVERLWEVEGALTQGNMQSYPIAIQEGGIDEATFSFHWNDGSEALSVQITRPDLSIVTGGVAGAEIRSGNGHVVFHVGSLQQGTWTVDVTATTGSPTYLGVLSGLDQQAASLQLEFGGTHSDAAHAAVGIKYLWGLPQPISAVLTDRGGALTGANVTALVEHPDGTFLALPLFDDGDHEDGAPADGVYGNVYTRTTSTNIWGNPGMQGSYRTVVVATGTNSLAQNFVRIRKKAFLVSELNDPPPDSDMDSMPDRYEALHHCLDAGVNDADDDPDLDGLTNDFEWAAGTDPCHPDTDRGGESDGSEAVRAANPFDPSDDALPVPIDPEVIDWVAEHLPFPAGVSLEPNCNLIRYPRNISYTTMDILRSTSDLGPFSVIANLSGPAMTGLYQDMGLANGTTYYYMVRPGDLNGNKGAPSRIFWGTPKANPIPPVGSFIINDNAPFADSLSATLSLVASIDVADMMIANTPSFSGAVWQPFAETLPWTLLPDPSSGVATVYVKFRDVDANESPSIYNASTTVVTAGTLGRLGGRVSVLGLPDLAGISIRIVGELLLPPVYTDSLGDFVMFNMPAGTYTLIVERHGYQPVTVPDVAIPVGGTVDVGVIQLFALPAIPLLPTVALGLLATALAVVGLQAASRRVGRDEG